MSHNQCQIYCLQTIAEPIGRAGILRQRLNRLKRIIKRRWRYIVNWFFRSDDGKSPILCIKAKHSTSSVLKPGDLVRVRSREEIQNTLDNWNQMRGCSFLEEMWPYCGTRQRVFKRVEKFLDERDYLMKHCKSVVLLEGVFCEGTKDFRLCDRSCFYFWSDEWLEKID